MLVAAARLVVPISNSNVDQAASEVVRALAQLRLVDVSDLPGGDRVPDDIEARAEELLRSLHDACDEELERALAAPG